MRQTVWNSMLAVCLVGVLVVNAGVFAADYLSPVSVVSGSGGKVLYIAEATAEAVAVFDVASGKVVKTIAVADSPVGLAISEDGGKLFVTSAVASGKVQVINTAAAKVTASIAVGHTPIAVVASPDGKLLYVCNKFDNNIGVVDLAAKKQVATIAVSRAPVAAAITADSKFLFVANLLPAGAADALRNLVKLDHSLQSFDKITQMING